MIRKMLFASTVAIVMVMVFMTSTAFASIDPVFGPPGGEIEVIVSPTDDKTKPGATSIYILIKWTEDITGPTEKHIHIDGAVGPSC